MSGKKITVFILVLCALGTSISCVNKTTSTYKHEELLIRYLKDYHYEIFSELDCGLLVYKQQSLCSNCLPEIELTEVIKTVKEHYDSLPLFMLTDKKYYQLPPDFQESVTIIDEDPKVLQKHGLHHSYIHWFHIRDLQLIEWYCFMDNEALNNFSRQATQH
jgi:hypothetical protein